MNEPKMPEVKCYPNVWFGPVGCRGCCSCGWLSRIYKSAGPAIKAAEKHAGCKWQPVEDRKQP